MTSGSGVKKHIQTLLRRLGVYHRFKASVIYDLYWGFADSRVIAQRRAELSFYRELLEGFRKGDLIFDIGANHGAKTDVFLRLGARVVAVDPDEKNQEILRQKFLSLRLAPRPVVVVGKAVSDCEAVETMWIDSPGSAKNTLSQKWVETLRNDEARFGERLNFADNTRVQTVTLDQLIGTHGSPFFIKIDVEGFEPTVLRGMQHPVPYLSFEVNLPEFRPEGVECIKWLYGIAAEGRFNFTPDCQKGLMLERWLDATSFLPIFGRCEASSIEVFWKTAT
jgi:FkbM family methyltransferase